MTRLDQVDPGDAVVHLLLIADSKAGKSTYAAEAAIAGFHLIYLDSDNGLSALLATINKEKNAEEIKRRVDYFKITHPRMFLQLFLRSSPTKPLFWAPNKNKAVNVKSPDMDDSEPIWVFNAKAIPASSVLVLDSWTSLSQDALQQLRAEQSAPLLEGTDQQVYGEAKAAVDYFANIMQSLPYHLIVQAHPTRYEVYEKPANTTGADLKQRDMKLIDTYEIPVSTSRVSGLDMGKRFNHIGWLNVTPTGTVEIDFTRKPKRVGGGPPNRKARTNELNFLEVVKLSGGPLPYSVPFVEEPNLPWFKEVTFGDLKKRTNPTSTSTSRNTSTN